MARITKEVETLLEKSLRTDVLEEREDRCLRGIPYQPWPPILSIRGHPEALVGETFLCEWRQDR